MRIKEIVESLFRNELWKDKREDILNESLKKVVEGSVSPYEVAESLYNDYRKSFKVSEIVKR